MSGPSGDVDVDIDEGSDKKNIPIPLDMYILIGPRHDKTCVWVFRQSEIQTSLLSYRD